MSQPDKITDLSPEQQADAQQIYLALQAAGLDDPLTLARILTSKRERETREAVIRLMKSAAEKQAGTPQPED